MEQKDKELVLKDLSARLPYKVIVHVRYDTGEPCYGELTPIDIKWFIDSKIKEIKPYLRPMSSMTEEEKAMYEGLMIGTDNISYMLDVIDWLNAYHFDYRGLISMGLALEAPKGMYNV